MTVLIYLQQQDMAVFFDSQIIDIYQEYPITLSFLESANNIGLPLDKLITHRYPLTQMNEALEMNISMEGIEVVYVNENF